MFLMTRKVSIRIIATSHQFFFTFTERMGDGEYEFADDGKLFKPPTVKLLSAKLKSGPGKGVVSKNIISFLMEKN